MLVKKFFMLSPARIHGSCHRLQKKFAGQIAFEEVLISLRKMVPRARFQRAAFRLGVGFTNFLFSTVTKKPNKKACACVA